MRTEILASTTFAPEANSVGFTSFLYGCFVFCTLWLLVDPLYTEFGHSRIGRDYGFIKYIPLLIFGFGALLFTLMGQGIFRPLQFKTTLREITRAWPIWLYAGILLAGSVYVRQVENIEETFLPAALAVFSFLVSFIHIRFHPDPLGAIRRLFYALLLASLPMSAWIVYLGFNQGQAFHVEIFLIVPLAVYFFMHWNNKPMARWLVLFFFVAVGVLSQKNTGYLVTLFIVGYIGLVLFAQMRRQTNNWMARLSISYVALVVSICMVAAISFLLLNREVYLPSGNVEYRLSTYNMAWTKFMGSPIWGTMFAETPVIKFTLFEVGLANNLLPTHSDIMDALAHGGILGFSLFLAALTLPVAKAFRLLMKNRVFLLVEEKAVMHGLMAVLLSGVLVMAFNPLLLNYVMGSLFWLIQGFLLGIANRLSLATSKSI